MNQRGKGIYENLLIPNVVEVKNQVSLRLGYVQKWYHQMPIKCGSQNYGRRDDTETKSPGHQSLTT